MLNLSRRQWAVRLLAGLLGLSSLALQAQDAPAAKIIVGFPAGGSFDAIARLIAEKAKNELNRPVVVDNKTRNVIAYVGFSLTRAPTPIDVRGRPRVQVEVEALVETLHAHGHRAEALHGGMAQRQRDRVMAQFRAQQADLLVATDVAARGLDIDHLSHVVNYDVPSAPEVYTHRIGRTGRAGRTGVAITLAEPREHRLLRSIEHFTKARIDIGVLPTVADLRARRLDLTRASLREQLVAGNFDTFRRTDGREPLG